MTHPQLCPGCQKLFLRPEVPRITDPEIKVPYDQADMKPSADRGCSVCLITWDRLQSLHSRIPLHQTVYGAIYFWHPDYEHNVNDNEELDPKFVLFGTGQGTGFEFVKTCFLKLYLRKSSETKNPEAIVLPEYEDAYGRDIIPVSSSVAPTNSGDERCLDTMRVWMEKCLRDHKICSPNKATAFIPTRLINIGLLGKPRLIESSEEGLDPPAIRYATLSHRWRQNGMPKLLQSNLAHFKQQIDLTNLPMAFRDSLMTAKRLDIRYLWIDALCIIQDDSKDWERESSMMGQVYRNACINFGACAAAKQDVGLFIDRDPRLVSVTPLTIRRADHEADYFGFTERMFDDLLDTDLSDRGWILQERLLSPRSVFFGKQLIWECSESVACEMFPEGLYATQYVSPWGQSGNPLRLANLLKTSHDCVEDEKSGMEEIYRKWLHVTEKFTKCRLTYEDDVFPALSGLAKWFQAILQDEYFAGLWKKDFVRGLLWMRSPFIEDLGDEISIAYPIVYRAPSWSWASVLFMTHNPQVSHPTTREYLATVEEAAVTQAGSDPMGKLSGGYIRITAYVKWNHTHLASGNDPVSPPNLDYYDDPKRVPAIPTGESVLHTIIAYQKQDIHQWNKSEGKYTIFRERLVYGLLLERVPGDMETYRRIGMFVHHWVPSRQDQSSDSLEVPDFENEGFERRTITII